MCNRFGGSPLGRIIASNYHLNEKGIVLNSVIHRSVGNDMNTLFWKQNWVGKSNIATCFPILFWLEVDKECTIVSHRGDGGWKWNRRRPIRGGTEMSQYLGLINCLTEVHFNEQRDRWMWMMGEDGSLPVRVTRRWIGNIIFPNSNMETRWNDFLPRKVNILIWRVLRDLS